MAWHKFKAQKTIVDGITFPSKLEAALYGYLRLLKDAGKIIDLELHPTVRFARLCDCGSNIDINMKYKADAKAFDVERNKMIWYEAKGVETEGWRKNKKLWKFFGPGPLQVFKGSGKHVYLAEEIIPH